MGNVTGQCCQAKAKACCRQQCRQIIGAQRPVHGGGLNMTTGSGKKPTRIARFCRNSGVWPKRVASLSWRSNSEAVELLRCGHGLTGGAVHLPLADHVHGLDSRGDDSSALKGFESEYRSGDSLDGPVVLFNDVVGYLF